MFRGLSAEGRRILQKHSRYYQSLDYNSRRYFEKRVRRFIKMKEFESRGELVVTLEMQVVIAAAAMQIVYGLPSVYLDYFYKIIIYPDTYQSSYTHQYHKGEVNSRGIIVLSWTNLVAGYANDADGRNLALHELAHALKLTDVFSTDERDSLDPEVLEQFTMEGRYEMERIVNDEVSFFRDYAATNDHEFFAVAVENFFERPQAFFEHHPRMYGLLATLLNQDPLARGNLHRMPLPVN